MIPLNKQVRSIIDGLRETFTAIDRLNGLEQAEAEALARIEAANAKVAEAKESFESLMARTHEAVAQARSDAKEAIEEANAKAEKIVLDAESKAEAMTANAGDLVLERTHEAKALGELIAVSRSELAALQAQARDLAPLVVESQALVDKAQAIKKAMG